MEDLLGVLMVPMVVFMVVVLLVSLVQNWLLRGRHAN